MAITITVETGSIVPNANSFATVAEARKYASDRGVTMPNEDAAGNDKIAAWLIRAMDYLNAQAFRGYPADSSLHVPFPRRAMFIDARDPYAEYPTNEIPSLVKDAQCALVIEQSKGIELMPTVSGAAAVKREKLGPIETEYAVSSVATNSPTVRSVEALLTAFLAVAPGLRLLRI